MVYLKPPTRVTKIFDRLAMRSTLWDVHTLEVARRNAVDPQRVPVIPLEYSDSLFVVSTRGESDWVKNVRAAGRVRLGQKGKFESYAATEVPAGELPGILTAYRLKAGREASGYWKRLPGASDHPTFRLTPSLAPDLTPSLTPELTPSLTPELTPSLTPELTPSLTPELTPSLTPGLTATDRTATGGQPV